MIVSAIIPARGGSRGIPRKNARLLHGRPLIEYAIEAALKTPLITRVFVSTDDPEIEAISQRMGVPVIQRPRALADERVTLDDVIVHAIETLERRRIPSDLVVTLQPTCPLVLPQTIERAIRQCIEESYDTVLTAVPDAHLDWTRDPEGRSVPLYQKRANRQYLAPRFRETGAVVVCRRQILERGSRVGEKIGVLEVSKSEAIDIDDHFDWWLAEKSMRRKRICFHVLGNHELGLGHVYRALTLADRLIDHELRFVVNQDSALAGRMIQNRYYPVQRVQRGEELAAILASGPDLVINDVLDTRETFVNSIRHRGIPVINFEDEGPGSMAADWVINAVYGTHPKRRDGRVLHGASCCCLRDEFYTVDPISVRHHPQSVLLLFGGTDSNGVTLRLFRWLDEMDGDWRITVIAGIGFRHLAELRAMGETARHPVEIVVDTKVISRYMSQADVAVTSGGRTVFELASLGVPMLVLSQNARERDHLFARESGGSVYLGDASRVGAATFHAAMGEVLGSVLLRKKMQDSLLGSEIRQGIRKVSDIIEATLNQATGVPA